MNRRLPKRSEKIPASGATTIVPPVHTSSLSPAWKGVLPSTFCMYWERKKIEPNMPKYMVSEATLVTAKERLAKNVIGSIGSGVRRSQATKPASSAAPASSVARIVELVQPSDCARTRPKTIPKRPPEASTRPGRSSLP